MLAPKRVSKLRCWGEGSDVLDVEFLKDPWVTGESEKIWYFVSLFLNTHYFYVGDLGKYKILQPK